MLVRYKNVPTHEYVKHTSDVDVQKNNALYNIFFKGYETKPSRTKLFPNMYVWYGDGCDCIRENVILSSKHYFT